MSPDIQAIEVSIFTNDYKFWIRMCIANIHLLIMLNLTNSIWLLLPYQFCKNVNL